MINECIEQNLRLRKPVQPTYLAIYFAPVTYFIPRTDDLYDLYDLFQLHLMI